MRKFHTDFSLLLFRSYVQAAFTTHTHARTHTHTISVNQAHAHSQPAASCGRTPGLKSSVAM